MKLNSTILIIILAISCFLTSCATDTQKTTTTSGSTARHDKGGFIMH